MPGNVVQTLSAYFLRGKRGRALAKVISRLSPRQGCFGNKIHPEKNRDILRLIVTAVSDAQSIRPRTFVSRSQIGLPDDGADAFKDKIMESYRDMDGIDQRSAQNQFIRQISQSNTYGMIHFELKVGSTLISSPE